MVFWVIFAGAAIKKVAKERDIGTRRMKEKEIHSRRTINIPRRNGSSASSSKQLLRAISKRYFTTTGSRLLDREIYFDEASGTLYVATGQSERLPFC